MEKQSNNEKLLSKNVFDLLKNFERQMKQLSLEMILLAKVYVLAITNYQC